jgi:hypothetical protein
LQGWLTYYFGFKISENKQTNGRNYARVEESILGVRSEKREIA